MEANLSRELLLEMHRRMWRIRVFEDTADEMHRKGEIHGGLHTSHGQEAEIVGACLALRTDDYMVGNHRSHGHPIGKGAKLTGLMAELFGRETGVCKGKGGSMHLADFSVGSLGETSIVGSGIPVATGAAYGAKMLGSDRVSLCFFGGGATNEGAFHEGVNFGAIWQLPVIYLCENNRYAVTTPISDTCLVADIADRAKAYGIPGVIVDGQDVIATYQAVTTAVRRARAGEGPTLIEAKTYRFKEHAANMGRVFEYRPEDELEHMRANFDPLKLFNARMTGELGFSQGELDAIEKEVRQEVEDCVAFAKASPYPDLADAFTDLFEAQA